MWFFQRTRERRCFCKASAPPAAACHMPQEHPSIPYQTCAGAHILIHDLQVPGEDPSTCTLCVHTGKKTVWKTPSTNTYNRPAICLQFLLCFVDMCVNACMDVSNFENYFRTHSLGNSNAEMRWLKGASEKEAIWMLSTHVGTWV